MRQHSFLLTCLSIAGLSFLCGCSSFESRWQSAGAAPTTAPSSLEGRWQGTWTSDANGHHGGLRCIITRKQDDIYLADFHATFWNIFSFGYSIDLKADAVSPTRYQFTGDSDLGWLAGGKYHYDGTANVGGAANSDSFDCTYKSSADNGKFNMTRPTTLPVAPAQ